MIEGKRVFACLSGQHHSSSHRCCAERLLLAWFVRSAIVHGVGRHGIASWVRRKAGNTIIVWRHTASGTLGCALPCPFCRKVIDRFGLRVKASIACDVWREYDSVSEIGGLRNLTSAQRRSLGVSFCSNK